MPTTIATSAQNPRPLGLTLLALWNLAAAVLMALLAVGYGLALFLFGYAHGGMSAWLFILGSISPLAFISFILLLKVGVVAALSASILSCATLLVAGIALWKRTPHSTVGNLCLYLVYILILVLSLLDAPELVSKPVHVASMAFCIWAAWYLVRGGRRRVQ